MRFDEVMAGTWDGRPLRMELTVQCQGLLNPFGDVTATACGRITVPGLVDDSHAVGTVEIAPLRRRRIRYQIGFQALDGRRLRLDGWKSIRLIRPVKTMTILPATVTEPDGRQTEARLWFDLRTLGSFLLSMRPNDPMTARWDGARGRLEVWYATLTDLDTGNGYWLHHELVAPLDGPVRRLGWLGIFPIDGPPELHRSDHWTEPLKSALWDLQAPAQRSLHTFPAWSWRHEILPASHVLARPGQTFTGTILGQSITAAPGGTGRIYGRNNARTWAWLHADLPGGGVLELVAAASHRLPVTTFLRLRLDNRDWPSPHLSAGLMRTEIGLPMYVTRGRVGSRRITVKVDIPVERRLSVEYVNPDGTPVVCHNSERANAWILLEKRTGGRWLTEREVRLDGTAHAEVGGHV